jgi:hypothetical protein
MNVYKRRAIEEKFRVKDVHYEEESEMHRRVYQGPGRLGNSWGTRKSPYPLIQGRVSKPCSLWAHPDLYKEDRDG